LIRGDQSLTTAQRVGFLLIAFDGMGTSLVVPVAGLWMAYLPFSVLALLVSLRIAWVALRPCAERRVNGRQV